VENKGQRGGKSFDYYTKGRSYLLGKKRKEKKFGGYKQQQGKETPQYSEKRRGGWKVGKRGGKKKGCGDDGTKRGRRKISFENSPRFWDSRGKSGKGVRSMRTKGSIP